MATKPDLATLEAQDFLQLMGYRVRDVPCGAGKSCDLCAEHPTGTLWIEAKRDEVPPADARRIVNGEAVRWERDIAVTTKVENTISHAVKQLRSSAPEGSLKLLWFYVPPPNDIIREVNIHCTLYGVRWFDLINLVKAGVSQVPVFLAARASFQQYPDIASAVVQSPGSMMLFTNPFHADLPALGSTRLCQVFGELHSIFTIHWASTQPDTYVIDPAVAGKSEAAVIRNLEERHGVIAQPTTADATTTAWPGNETGRVPTVAGAGRGRQPFHFRYFLQGVIRADGTLVHPPSTPHDQDKRGGEGS